MTEKTKTQTAKDALSDSTDKTRATLDEAKELVSRNLEPVNLKLATQKTNAEPDRNWSIDYQILRKDRAVFYVNHINKGVYLFEYLARVRASGQATAPAAKAAAAEKARVEAEEKVLLLYRRPLVPTRSIIY